MYWVPVGATYNKDVNYFLIMDTSYIATSWHALLNPCS